MVRMKLRRRHGFLAGCVILSIFLTVFVIDYHHILSSKSVGQDFVFATQQLVNRVSSSLRNNAWFISGNQTEVQKKIKISIFFGTRPEVIKLAPVIQQLNSTNDFELTIVFTGQHDEIIHPYLKLFGISVDVWFNQTLVKGQSLGQLTGRLYSQADRLQSEPNDIWMVQGDTTSAMVIATAAFYRNIRVAHVEAGLRTFDMYSPFPEEFNRKTISTIATYHFVPTENNRQNLLAEGIDESRIYVTGNTVIDTVRILQSTNRTKIPKDLCNKNLFSKIMVLITLHRRENIKKMDTFYQKISSVKCNKCLFIVPLHPNPLAANAAKNACVTDTRFQCISPLPYEELHWVLNRSKFILTDSGGLQEEATWYNLPTLILRKDTERCEAVKAGVAKLVNEYNLVENMQSLLKRGFKRSKNLPYGDGFAAERIKKVLQFVNLPKHSLGINPNAERKIFRIKQLEVSPNYFETFKKANSTSIAVILQVFRRKTLEKQLRSISNQTLMPSSVIIVQSGNFVNISSIITNFRELNLSIEVQHIASSKNLRFHGRFYIAYMLKEDYVSIWDDDVMPRSEWLEYCVEFSKSHDHALVGANGRTFEYIDVKTHTVIQSQKNGKNDFVGHTWTLPRVYLRYYLNMEPVSLYTGEDVQLSFALQQYGIGSYKPPFQGEKSVKELKETIDKNASFKKNQAPRQLLFCTLFKHSFKSLRCRNCNDTKEVETCISKYSKTATKVIDNAFSEDRLQNDHSWS